MGDYGIKVSRAGYPVETAADNQLLFSSAFASLLTVYEGTLTSGSDFYHNLGYYPVVVAQTYSSISGSEGGTVSYTRQFGICRIYTDHIHNSSSQTITYYIYALDLRSVISARNINTTPASQSTPNQDYGFKVSSDGNDVMTAGLQDLVAFSGVSQAGYGVRQQIIHQSGYQDSISSGSTVNISHDLGYPPMFLAFTRTAGGSYYLLASRYIDVNEDASISITFQVTINSSQITVYNNLGYSIDFAYVIFKDPF